MEIHQLENFLQLAKYENVSLTADFLNISQPALSKCLASIEQEVGVKLFDRVGRKIILNEHGRIFARYAEQTISSLKEGMFVTQRLNQTILGTLTIGLYSYGPIIFQCLSEFSQLNPQINIQLIGSSESRSKPSLEDMDLILCSTTDNFYSEKNSFWITQPLFKERYVLVISSLFRSYPTEKKTIDLLEFRDDPFIVMPQNEIFTDLTYKYCNDAGFIPKALYEVDEFILKLKFVQAGLCVAILPESCLQDARTFDPRIQFFQIENFPCERTILIKRHKENFTSETAELFWDFLMEHFNIKN